MPLQTHPVTKVHRHVLFFLFLKTQKVKGHYPLLFAFNNTLGNLFTSFHMQLARSLRGLTFFSLGESWVS